MISRLIRAAYSGAPDAVCGTTWANGSGASCVGGSCMPGSCAAGYTLNPSSASCVNIQNDANNWYARIKRPEHPALRLG